MNPVLCMLVWLCLLVSSTTSIAETTPDHPTWPSEIQFLQDNASDTWQADEIKKLSSFIRTLPPALTDTGNTPLRLYKNHRTINPQSHPKPINLLVHEQSAGEQQLLHQLLLRYEQNHCASCNPGWRVLSGWQRGLLGISLQADNQDPRGYASADGLASPAEDFITAAEHYFLPPPSSMEASIRCRTPKKYAYIKQLFNDAKSPLELPDQPCRRVDEGLLDDISFFDANTGKPIQMGPINMETVTGFELLYATPGTGDASEIAGHLLLRIKLNNNPEATQLGIENPNDLVISFLANTGDGAASLPPVESEKLQCKSNWLNIVDDGRNDYSALHSIVQSLKGLSGGFITLMNRQTLAEAVKNYTIEEDRDLLRYELLLNAQQRESLLEHLHLAKKNYNTAYYFFNQNCASVLVKVIAQGIGQQQIADFNPIVSAPNSLVGLFINHGLAQPVTPSFYSYRKQGFIAQELIKSRYLQLQQSSPQLTWPAIDGLFNQREATRLKTVESIFHLLQTLPQQTVNSYHLANLIQESEMTFDHKNLACENYTSAITATARQFQQQLRRHHPTLIESYSFNAQQQFQHHYGHEEQRAYRQGTPHTQLHAYSLGLGEYRRDTISSPILSLRGVLDEQPMGSTSNIAMQRGNYVKLGAANIELSLDTPHQGALHRWNLTALQLRKLKERLNHIPSYFSPAGTLGMGLTLLNIEADHSQHYRRSSIAGGELVMNIASSYQNNDFLFLSVGAELAHHHEPGISQYGLMIPLHIESLLTAGGQRRWQWRNQVNYHYAIESQLNDHLTLGTRLSYRIGQIGNTQLLVNLSSEYHEYKSNHVSTAIKPWQSTLLSLEINHW